MKSLIFLLISIAIISGCSGVISPKSHVIIDWIDFIKVNDITYQAVHSESGRELEEDDLDGNYTTTTFKVSGNIYDSSYRNKNGDAAFLDEGTTIYKVKGYKPNFRLAAKRDNKIILYESDNIPDAKIGGDYFDISGKVKYISINSEVDGTTELARIEEPENVNKLINLLLTAPVKDDQVSGIEGTRYFLAFYLNDETVTSRVYWHDTGVFYRNIKVQKEFIEIIDSAFE